VHTQVSAFYSGKQNIPGFVDTEGLIFRDWLNTKSFKQQFRWGLDVLRFFGVDI